MPIAAAIRSRPLGVDGRGVDPRPDRPGAGQHACQGAVRPGHHRHVDRGMFEQVKDLARVGAHGCGDEIGDGDVTHPGEAVHSDAVRLGDQADGPALEDDHCGAVRTLVDQRGRVGHRVVSDQRHRGVDDQVPALDEVHRLFHHRDRKVLRQNHNAAAAGHRLGHPASGHGGHVGDHDGDGGARPVRRGQVDVEPRRHVRPTGNDEDVVIGQVIRWRLAVKEAHHRPV